MRALAKSSGPQLGPRSRPHTLLRAGARVGRPSRPTVVRAAQNSAEEQAAKEAKKQAEQLDRAVKTLNDILVWGEKFRGKKKPQSDKDKNNFTINLGEGEKKEKKPGSMVRFKGEARSVTPIQWPKAEPEEEEEDDEEEAAAKSERQAESESASTSAPASKEDERKAQLKLLSKVVATPIPGRTLGAYLSLPLEEYSLLDPSWIKREEGGIFVLTVPLEEMTGLALKPKVWVKVAADAETNSVNFEGFRFSLGAQEFDELFEVKFVSRLQSQGEDAALKTTPGVIPPDSTLLSTATVDMGIMVPHPWSMVPGFLLKNAASTILSAVMQNVLSAFADLLARDYRRWATGIRDKSAAVGRLTGGRRAGGWIKADEPSIDSDGNIVISADEKKTGELAENSSASAVESEAVEASPTPVVTPDAVIPPQEEAKVTAKL